MKKKNSILLITSVSIVMFWTSCNKKEQAVAPPLPGNEPLTTMILKLTNASDASDTLTAEWAQLDPTGATAPDTSHATMTLKANASYLVQVKLLDSLSDITPEIRARENYHLFCFGISSGLDLSAIQTDRDTNPTPLPVGLTDMFSTTAASSGNLEVTLHHQPNVKNGDCAPGSIDMDCNFRVIIH